VNVYIRILVEYWYCWVS